MDGVQAPKIKPKTMARCREMFKQLGHGHEDRRLKQLEEMGSAFACLIPLAVSGGQRIMELQLITLRETEQNKVRCMHYDKDVGGYLLGDCAKQ